MGKLYIIGIGYKPLGKQEENILIDVPCIVLSTRLFEVFKNYQIYPLVRYKLIFIKSFKVTLNFIKDVLEKDKDVALLTSGDPFFFGAGIKALKLFGEEKVKIYPDLSCLQKGLSLIKKPWSGIKTISLHGRKPDFTSITAVLKKEGKVCILTDSKNDPSFVAELILKEMDVPEEDLKFYIFERLGYPDQRLFTGCGAEVIEKKFKEPNFLIVEYKKPLNSDVIFGLKEEEIVHQKGMITKDEVRAVVIHKLRLPEKGIVWDIGAGSGAVSLEIARLNPYLEVYAIEKEDTQFLEENRRFYSVSNLKIIKGTAPDCLKELPFPDRVFIGGSRGRLKEILRYIAGISSVKIVVLTAITLETLTLALNELKQSFKEVDISQINITKLEPFKTTQIFKAKNPIFIIRGER